MWTLAGKVATDARSLLNSIGLLRTALDMQTPVYGYASDCIDTVLPWFAAGVSTAESCAMLTGLMLSGGLSDDDVLLETLSIIAYKQPITKIEIEKIRGVKSDHAVNKLVEYNLVCELGRKDAPGRPLLFGTTEDFLRCFGVQSLDDLPILSQDKMEEFKTEAEQEAQLKLQV